MYEIMVNESFCAAHFLRGYQGKCENMHGHNYKVHFVIRGEKLDDIGMLLDFVDIRRELKDVLDVWDHHVMNDLKPFDEINPTAENIARTVCEAMSHRLDLTRASEIECRVWETDRSRASYRMQL